MNAMRKHYRLTEEFTYGTLLIQSAYLPVGATPADGDWETEHTYDWDSPQETLRSLLSAMSDFAGALAGAQAANGDYAVKVITLNKKLEALEQAGPTPADESEVLRDLHEELRRADDANKAMAQALTEANSQRNDLRSQLITATKAAQANPIYMSCRDRDNVLLELDDALRHASHNNNERSAAVALIRKHAVPMHLMDVQPTLAQCGNIMRAMLYMYYQNLNETVFTDDDKAVARKLQAFINAAKA